MNDRIRNFREALEQGVSRPVLATSLVLALAAFAGRASVASAVDDDYQHELADSPETGNMCLIDLGDALPEIPSYMNDRFQRVARDLDERFDIEGKFVVVDPSDPENQVLVVMEKLGPGEYPVVIAYPTSTGKNGFGFTKNSGQTPTGNFQFAHVDGRGRQFGTIYSKQQYGQRTTELDAEWGKALMTTRVLYIEGLDPENRGTRGRSIVIHGTNKEGRLGNKDSGGCVRMGNDAVIYLSAIVTGQTDEGRPVYLNIIDPVEASTWGLGDDMTPVGLSLGGEF